MNENGHAHLLPADVAASLGETLGRRSRAALRKLARSLQRAIDDGHLPGGSYLPSERVLAHTLFVSRSTVVAAYRTLREQGTLASRRGSGTWIRGRSRRRVQRRGSARHPRPRSVPLERHRHELGAYRPNPAGAARRPRAHRDRALPRHDLDRPARRRQPARLPAARTPLVPPPPRRLSRARAACRRARTSC